jgi:hypothetical protein
VRRGREKRARESAVSEREVRWRGAAEGSTGQAGVERHACTQTTAAPPATTCPPPRCIHAHPHRHTSTRRSRHRSRARVRARGLSPGPGFALPGCLHAHNQGALGARVAGAHARASPGARAASHRAARRRGGERTLRTPVLFAVRAPFLYCGTWVSTGRRGSALISAALLLSGAPPPPTFGM